MDISIITISENLQEKLSMPKIAYAGAMNPLYYIQNNEFSEIKATKRAIGGSQEEEKRFFLKHEIVVQKKEHFSNSSTIYLCTDGYQDQFGGKINKKFTVKKLRTLLFNISEKPMWEQNKILNQTLENWIIEGNEKQIDDITILGIRF
jgi:serine phosphatase RsbU (regulator of sigma subunit)